MPLPLVFICLYMYRLFFLLLLLISVVRADEFDTLRLNWASQITGTGYDLSDANVQNQLVLMANTANSAWSSMNKAWVPTMVGGTNTTPQYLWADAASSAQSVPALSAHLTDNYNRLYAMALAYATPGCSLQGNTALAADIISGLDWMYANRYNTTVKQYDNWFDWVLGAPTALNDTVVLLYPLLSGVQISNYMAAVDRFVPIPLVQIGQFPANGGNLMGTIRVVAVRGCIVKDTTKLALARDAFPSLFQYVTTDDGFYTDGSFIQHHTHPYTGGYGAGALGGISPIMSLLAGSTWAVTDPSQANVYNWIFNSFQPVVYNGLMWDGVRGRGISGANSSAQSGQGVMTSILQIAQSAPPDLAGPMKSMVKAWALNNTVRGFLRFSSLANYGIVSQLMADPSIKPSNELIGHFAFPRMDRVMHLGAGYGFGLSMCSTRISNFESFNGDNLHGWFIGDGMTTLYNIDLQQYADSYWPTVDPYRLPGVTSDPTPKLPPSAGSVGTLSAQGGNTLTPYSWVGGATLGNYGASGMQFKGCGVSLTAYKSWFMFDTEIVCLGAGISSTDSSPIETTVENRMLAGAGANAFIVNGTAQPATLGWSSTLSNVSSIYLAGNVAGAAIGYYFPQPATLTAVREARTGAWSDIGQFGSTTSITRNYLRFGFNHGSNPSNATYQYVLLPGASARLVSQYAERPPVSVIVNDTTIQAVSQSALGITAANFWTDTTQSAGIITADKKCSVLVKEDGTFIDIAVSDPTQLNTGSINLQIALNGGTLVSADSGVTVTQISPNISLNVSVAGALGKTFKARFSRLPPQQVVNLTPEADSYVYDATASVNSNFGDAPTLEVKAGAAGYNRVSFLRFNVPVPAAGGGVMLGATLKLLCLSAQTPGVHGVAKVDDNSWTETGITWNNQPAAGAVLSTWTPTALATSIADVTRATPVSGPISFAVYSTTQTSNGSVSYASKENASAANLPRLWLSYFHTPPQVSMTSPATGAYITHAGSITLTANALATDGAITGVAFYDGTTLLGTASAAPYSVTPSIAGGTHYIKAVATDANGLSSTSLPIRIDVAYPPTAAAFSLSTVPNTPVDIDLRTLVSDVDTPLASLKLQLGSATNGTVAMLADGHTARFTPAVGYTGAASFAYSVTDTARDARTLLNYSFQNGDVTDSSGQGRDGTLNIQGTGAASFVADSPLADYTQSLALAENGTTGAAQLDCSFLSTVLDLQNADWTIAGWFKRNTTANMDSIVQLGNSGGFASNAMTLAFTNSTNSLALLNYNGSTQDVNISNSSVITGMWHHFAIVRSGTSLSLYLDAKIVGSDSGFTFSFNNSSGIKFGGVITTALDRWLNGSLADLAVFNAALSPADITKLTSTPVQWFGGQSASATVNIGVLKPIEAWRLQNFGTTSATGNAADSADPDGDGLPNLIEYACATDPNTPSIAPYALNSNGANFEFLYTKNKAATDVTYSVEWSNSLLTGSWSTAGVTSFMVSDNGDTQQIKATVPAGTSGRIFVRLRVTR